MYLQQRFTHKLGENRLSHVFMKYGKSHLKNWRDENIADTIYLL